jgi:SPP1 gp7 family putative phage head morphogenesis protein
MPEFLVTPTPHTEAIDFIASKPAIARSVFDELFPELKSLSFTIAGIEDANVLQSVRNTIATLPAGAPWDVVKKQIVSQISPYLVDPHANTEEQAKQIAAAEAKAELLLRINGQTAYAAASYRVMDAQRAVFKYWQYQTMRDSKVRASHRALDGLVLPADSTFWKTHFPPWDFGCRCVALAISDMSLEHIRKQNPELILDPDRLRKLETENVIERFDAATGTRQFVDIAPAQTPGAWRWHPGQVEITPDELKKRYDPEVWNAFEKWARKTDIPNESRTVWQWMNGEPGGPKIASVDEEAALGIPKTAGRYTVIPNGVAQIGDEYLKDNQWLPIATDAELQAARDNDYPTRRKN